MADNKHVLTFHSDAVDEGSVHILELSGVEEISRYFVFTLDLVSKKADIDFKEMLKKPARIEIKQGVKLAGGDKRGQQTLKIHGVLRSFEQVEQRLDWARYRCELVPPLWKLSLNFQSRIFMDKTVPEIVKEVFMEAGMSDGTDFEFKLQGSYPTREFVMQYEESDLDFIDRWLEHEGIFYFWEHNDQGSKLVLANATAAYNPMQGTPTIAYKPVADNDNRVEAGDSDKASEDWFREEVIPIFHCTQKVIPKKVILKEYNWRNPTDELKVEHKVSDDGIGTVYEYNNHYKDSGEGKKLAEVRAQEHLCREVIFSGESDCKSFRAGATYTLEKHYREDFNKEYLLTGVTHTASQTVELASNSTIDAKYRNRFTSIPADRVFRPLRQTKWPQISGFMHAKVDSSGSGQYAEIDDMGRYKIKLPLDLSDKKDGKASRYVRMAQPYSGANMGMHFPLHKGTEVLLTFMDGDPDRPIIASSVPNPDTASPVTGGNQTQCAIHTGGGNKIVIEDSDGSQRMTLFTPHANTKISMGAPNSPDPGIWCETDANFCSETRGYTREHTVGVTEEHREGDVTIAHDSNHNMTVGGNHNSTIVGDAMSYIGGKFVDTVTGRNSKFILGGSTEVIIGGKLGFISPYKQEVVAGASVSNIMGAKAETIYGAKLEAIKGVAIAIKQVKTYELTPTKETKFSLWKDTIGVWRQVLAAHKQASKGNVDVEAAAEMRHQAATLKQKASKIEVNSESTMLRVSNMHLRASRLEEEADLIDLAADVTVKKELKVKNGAFTVK